MKNKMIVKNKVPKQTDKPKNKIIIEQGKTYSGLAVAIAKVMKAEPLAALYDTDEFESIAQDAYDNLFDEITNAVNKSDGHEKLVADFFNNMVTAAALTLLDGIHNLCEVPEDNMFEAAHALLDILEKDVENVAKQDRDKVLN